MKNILLTTICCCFASVAHADSPWAWPVGDTCLKQAQFQPERAPDTFRQCAEKIPIDQSKCDIDAVQAAMNAPLNKKRHKTYASLVRTTNMTATLQACRLKLQFK